MSQVQIRSTITTALATWAATKSIPIAREGQSFTPPANNGTFLELLVIPANTFTRSTDAESKRFLGEVMINIWVKAGVGTGQAEALAEEIAALFPVVPKNYLPVSVEQTPSIKRSIVTDNGYRVTPVCFSYRAEY